MQCQELEESFRQRRCHTFRSSGDQNNYKLVISLVRRACRLSHDRFLFGKHCRNAISDYGDASTLRMAGHELQLGIFEPLVKYSDNFLSVTYRFAPSALDFVDPLND